MRATINNPIASDSRNPIELPTRRSDSSPRHYISPPLRFNPFYSPPFHRPTFHFLRSFRLVRWPRTRTKQSFHVSVKRDSRQVAASLGNNFDQPLKERNVTRSIGVRIIRRCIRVSFAMIFSRLPRFSERPVIEIGDRGDLFPRAETR